MWQCRAVVSVAGARVALAVERVEVAGAREREAVCGVCGAVWHPGGVWAPHGGGECSGEARGRW